MPTVDDSNAGKSVILRRRGGSCAEDQRDQLYPLVTIGVLPNTVLLEIFSFYVDRPRADEDIWHTLIHVCRQWRFVVFDSPRRLNLRLLYTPNRPLKVLGLNVWPALPIVINALARGKRPRGMTNIAAALTQNCRVHKINIRRIPTSLMKRFAAMRKPFPELTYLALSSDDVNVPILPDSFLGGSAPRLHTLDLGGIPFPVIRKLLLSTSRSLVTLRLWSIPNSGYISPQAMVACLSALTALQSFKLGFRSPQPRVGRGTRRPPPLTRIVLAALTMFRFKGNSEYLEDIVSLVDAPLLDYFSITFFNQLIFDTPLLRHFISRTDTIKAHYRGKLSFYNGGAGVSFVSQEGMADHEHLSLEISCTPSDWQLSSLAQVCTSSLPPLSTLEHLEIFSCRSHWQDNIESTQWLELLYPFTSVKNLVLSDGLVRLVAPALQELAGDSVTEVLPMLQNLLFDGPELSGPSEKSIQAFIDARQRSGRTVAPILKARNLKQDQHDRSLNVTDALSYLDAVKVQSHDRPVIYNIFLDIMDDCKSQGIDISDVIQRVANLFHGHPSLIQGFNTFLPVGYRIEVGSDAQSSEVITVTTPSGTMLQSTDSPSIPPQPAPPLQEPGQPSLDQPSLPHPLPSTSVLGLSNAPKPSASSIDGPSFDDQECRGSDLRWTSTNVKDWDL